MSDVDVRLLELKTERIQNDVSLLRLNMEGREQSGRSDRIRSWFAFLTAIASAAITAYVASWATEAVDKQRLQNETLTVMDQYVDRLSNAESAHIVSLTLSTMIRSKMVEPDVLFETAYRLQDRFPTIIPSHFVSYYVKHFPAMASPFGTVDDVGVEADKLIFKGWVLDDLDPKKINFSIMQDGKLVELKHEKDGENPLKFDRTDPNKVFSNYPDTPAQGYQAYVDLPPHRPEPYLFEIKLNDDDLNYVVIYRRGICVGQSEIRITYLDDAMVPKPCP